MENLLVNQVKEVSSLDPCSESIERLPDDLKMRELAKQSYNKNIPFNDGHFDQAQFHQWGHQKILDVTSLGDLLKRCGFSVERIRSRSFLDLRRSGFKFLAKAIFRYVLGRMGEPSAGSNLYFVVRNK